MKTKKKTVTKSVAQLKKEADKHWSLATRYRFAEFKRGEWFVACVTCGEEKRVKEMQCGHFQSRRYSSTRFSEVNTAPQCVRCNMFNQGEQYKFSKFIKDSYGEKALEDVIQEAQQYHKFTVQELEEIIHDSKEQVKWMLEHAIMS